MSNEIGRDASWAFASDKLGRWLLHLPSGVVGKVGRVYAPREYRLRDLNGVEREEQPRDEDAVYDGSRALGNFENPAIMVAVIEFEDGNAFLADPKNFQILGEGDVQVFLALTQGIRDLVTAAAMAAVNTVKGCTPEGIAAVARAALQAQLRALSKPS